ncbi:hypothetical protein CEXT_37851 [Caerostris extrusa]|uniref:Uncharacterized protein n=1 Tax=Caerostris extrusa TaxID=172846 RepID=A0AAV4XBP5_CAEEX|nr:hypothetical protein CEXT_37851 [Caerostris extrusa]
MEGDFGEGECGMGRIPSTMEHALEDFMSSIPFLREMSTSLNLSSDRLQEEDQVAWGRRCATRGLRGAPPKSTFCSAGAQGLLREGLNALDFTGEVNLFVNIYLPGRKRVCVGVGLRSPMVKSGEGFGMKENVGWVESLHNGGLMREAFARSD